MVERAGSLAHVFRASAAMSDSPSTAIQKSTLPAFRRTCAQCYNRNFTGLSRVWSALSGSRCIWQNTAGSHTERPGQNLHSRHHSGSSSGSRKLAAGPRRRSLLFLREPQSQPESFEARCNAGVLGRHLPSAKNEDFAKEPSSKPSGWAAGFLRSIEVLAHGMQLFDSKLRPRVRST